MGGNVSESRGMNNSGQIVGVSSNASAINTLSVPVLWSNGQIVQLQTLGGTSGYANQINSANWIVGASRTSQDETHATLWQGLSVTDLGMLNGGQSSWASDINDSGQIAGNTVLSKKNLVGNSINRATLWTGTVATDLGTLGGESAGALSINNQGQVVGWSKTPTSGFFDKGHAALWSNGQIIDLGVLPGTDSSVANCINNLGQIAGSSTNANGGVTYATLWNPGSYTPVDMNTLLDANTVAAGWKLMVACINDNGWIVGTARNLTMGLGYRAFALIPNR